MTTDPYTQLLTGDLPPALHEPDADDRGPCNWSPKLRTPCAGPSTLSKLAKPDTPDYICDKHEVERRAENCGITPQQWMRNTGHAHEIPLLFGTDLYGDLTTPQQIEAEELSLTDSEVTCEHLVTADPATLNTIDRKHRELLLADDWRGNLARLREALSRRAKEINR